MERLRVHSLLYTYTYVSMYMANVIRYPVFMGRHRQLATPTHIKNPSANGRSHGQSERHLAQERESRIRRARGKEWEAKRVREREREKWLETIQVAFLFAIAKRGGGDFQNAMSPEWGKHKRTKGSKDESQLASFVCSNLVLPCMWHTKESSK